MNMKKSIAAVMAGAMAVSAMAATVSADQDAISLTYDLKRYELVDGGSSRATYVETYTAQTESAYTIPAATTTLTFASNSTYTTGIESAEITVTGITYVEDGSAAKTISQTLKYTSDAGFAAKNPEYIFNTAAFDGSKFVVPCGDGTQSGKLNIAAYNLETLGYSEVANASELAGFSSVAVKISYKIPAQIKVQGFNSWSGFDKVYGELGIDPMKDAAPTLEYLNAGIDNTTTPFTLLKNGAVAQPTTAAFAGVTVIDKEEAIYPMKSDLNAPADVVAALQTRKAGGNYYTKPVAVLNDAIANNENVVFTFTSFNGPVATTKSHLYQEWVAAGRAYGWATSNYDWNNPTFGQHLYTNLDNSYSLYGSDAYDMYGSYSSAWGVNLFTGAIVVNNGLTMQLNDTDKFNWGSNTLSFDWFTITDEGKITDAKTFLRSMLLYTPVEWYWDKLDVVVGNTEEDDVKAGEGIDGEGDVIADEEIEEIVEEVVEEVVEDVEEPVVEAPVEAAPSPATGNAPVALAVIPVALAAAAVVAKKRG
jgi:hypothetical protein